MNPGSLEKETILEIKRKGYTYQIYQSSHVISEAGDSSLSTKEGYIE